MLNTEELYKGLPKEQAAAYRKEAVEKYGAGTVERSEKHINSTSKEKVKLLAKQQTEIMQQLALAKHEDPAGAHVQQLIQQHYQNIRQFWGTAGDEDKQPARYKGLGNLYVADERFTMVDGVPQPDFNSFLSKAMIYYADHTLS
jgi:hypothetical protein